MTKKMIACMSCCEHFTQCVDCSCKDGTHYEGGSIVTFRPYWKNKDFGLIDLFGIVDHTNNTEHEFFICFECQKLIIERLEAHSIHQLIKEA